MKLLNITTRYGNTKDLCCKVGYKGNIERNSIYTDYNNGTMQITYFNVDADGPSVSRTYALEEPMPTRSDVKTDDGTMLFYQEENLYFSEDGLFYYTEFSDVGFWYAPYIPLQTFKGTLQTGSSKTQNRPYGYQPVADDKPPPEPPAPPPPRIVRY
jgi:hypothetical protein